MANEIQSIRFFPSKDADSQALDGQGIAVLGYGLWAVQLG